MGVYGFILRLMYNGIVSGRNKSFFVCKYKIIAIGLFSYEEASRLPTVDTVQVVLHLTFALSCLVRAVPSLNWPAWDSRLSVYSAF